VAGTGIENARDIDAVMRGLAREPDIDASRVVVAGPSLGGWTTLAQGTLAGRDVKGLINFAGGSREADCHDQDAARAVGATRLRQLEARGR
jgi:dienelactone hydrolase